MDTTKIILTDEEGNEEEFYIVEQTRVCTGRITSLSLRNRKVTRMLSF